MFDAVRLINLVKEKLPLYDPKHKNHKNKDHTSTLWNEIGHKLNMTKREVKSKWQNLRSNYMREKRKACCRCPLDARISWPYFAHMSFLDDYSRTVVKKQDAPQNKIFILDDDGPEYIVPDDDDDCRLIIDTSDADGVEEDPLRPDVDAGIYDVEWDANDIVNGDGGPGATSVLGKRRWKITELKNDDPCNRLIKKVVTETSDAEDDDEMLSSDYDEKPNLDDPDDADLLFLKNLLPAIKELSPLRNIEFKEEVLQLLKCKMVESSAWSNSYGKHYSRNKSSS